MVRTMARSIRHSSPARAGSGGAKATSISARPAWRRFQHRREERRRRHRLFRPQTPEGREKVLAIVDNNGFVLAPASSEAPVNEADTLLLPDGLNALKRRGQTDRSGRSMARISTSMAGSIPGATAKISSTRGWFPTSRKTDVNRKAPKRGRKRLFNAAIHSLRLCVERTFSWEDKFKRLLLLRFEFVPSSGTVRYETDGLHIDQSEAFLWCLKLATS